MSLELGRIDLANVDVYHSAEEGDEKAAPDTPLGRGMSGRFTARERSRSTPASVLGVAELSAIARRCENASYSALFAVRQRYRQQRNLLADACDALDDYMTHLVATSAQRLKMCERLEVFSIGLSGHEGVVRQATAWCRAEHQRVVDSAEQRDGVRARFTTAVTALAAVNDAVDARLLWIDELALKLAREKEDWMQEMVKSQSKLQTTKSKNDEMVAAMAALENGIGSFTAQLDVWTAHTRDLLTPCLVSVVSSFALMGNDPLVAEQQKLLAAMSEQLDTVHREVLGMRHMASTRTEGAHEFPKLRALLASPVQRSYFRDFLVANHRQENLDFYVASTKFCDDFLPLCEPDVASTLNVRARRLTVKDARDSFAEGARLALKLDASALPQLTASASVIIDRFISANAPEPINIPGSMASEILRSLDTAPNMFMFDSARAHVLQMLGEAYLSFRVTPAARDMVCRLSHTGWTASTEPILHPLPSVVLTVHADAALGASIDEGLSGALPTPKSRRLGSFTSRFRLGLSSDTMPSLEPRSERLDRSARGLSRPVKGKKLAASNSLSSLDTASEGAASRSSVVVEPAPSVPLSEALNRSPRRSTPPGGATAVAPNTPSPTEVPSTTGPRKASLVARTREMVLEIDDSNDHGEEDEPVAAKQAERKARANSVFPMSRVIPARRGTVIDDGDSLGDHPMIGEPFRVQSSESDRSSDEIAMRVE